MTLPDEHLRYPRRARGMDHDRYDWSIMPRRNKLAWPGGAHLAVMIAAPLTWFPLNMAPQPRPPVGAFDDPYPNFRDYTHRDYGNRVGVFRLMEALDRFHIRATAPINAAVCERYPAIVAEGLRRGWEFIGHGLDMGQQHDSSLAQEDEARMISAALDIVRATTGQPVVGWLSPAYAESLRTPDLLAAAGVEYLCDWANDELPYRMRAAGGALHAMPLSYEINDATMIWAGHHSPLEFAQQVDDQFEWLYEESQANGGRVFTLSLHSWCIGQPHRIRVLDGILRKISERSGIWMATGAEILAEFKRQDS